MAGDGKYGLHSATGDAAAAFAALARVELVVTDCDGTLLYTDKTLGEPAKDAVRRLRHAGVRFTVASSRPGKSMRHIVEALSVDMPYASTTAAAWFGRAPGKCSRRTSCRVMSSRPRWRRSPRRMSMHGCSWCSSTTNGI